MAFLPFLRERSPQSKAFTPTQFISDRLGIPDPKFKIGDRIKRSYFCDDELDTENYGKTLTFYGFILWMLPDVQHHRWEYFLLDDNEKPKFFDCDLPYLDDEIELA